MIYLQLFCRLLLRKHILYHYCSHVLYNNEIRIPTEPLNCNGWSEYLLVKWFSLSKGVSIKELKLKLIIITKKLKSMRIYPFNPKKGIQLVRTGQAIRLYQLFRYNQFGRLSQPVSRSEGLIQSFSIRTE